MVDPAVNVDDAGRVIFVDLRRRQELDALFDRLEIRVRANNLLENRPPRLRGAASHFGWRPRGRVAVSVAFHGPGGVSRGAVRRSAGAFARGATEGLWSLQDRSVSSLDSLDCESLLAATKSEGCNKDVDGTCTAARTCIYPCNGRSQMRFENLQKWRKIVS